MTRRRTEPPDSPPDADEPAPLARFLRAFTRRYLRPRFIVQTLGTLVAAYFLSRTLAKLSGSALWLPRGWRVSMEVIATSVGFCAFGLAQITGESFARRQRRRAGPARGAFETITASAASAPDGSNVLLLSVGQSPPPAVAPAHHPHKAEHERTAHTLRYIWSLAFTALAFAFLLLYMGLRSRCVISCDVRNWVAQQERIAVAMNVRPEGATSHARRYAERSAAAAAAGEEREDPRENYSEIIDIPDFMDPVRDEIYVPYPLPEPEATYLRDQGDEFDQDGLTYVLDHEMDTVVDWLRRPWQPALFRTTIYFALLHLLIMACVGAAAGFVDPLEKLAEALGAHPRP